MKTIYKSILGIVVAATFFISCNKDNANVDPNANFINALKDTLTQLASRSDNPFYINHCHSIIEVINSRDEFTEIETEWLRDAYTQFNTTSSTLYGVREDTTYSNRYKPYIFSWKSPTDNKVSFGLMYPPKDWDQDEEYPLYIVLHGDLDWAKNDITYMINYLLRRPYKSFAFEDGYAIIPWGRGNLWYQGIAETDVWECIDEFERLANINQNRKYMLGHSMGGYGAWHFGILAPDMWAALGISIASIWYEESEITAEAVATLKDVPVYFMNGETDFNLRFNQEVSQMLIDAGNPNVEMIVFEGGHIVTVEGVENMYLWLRQFEKN